MPFQRDEYGIPKVNAEDLEELSERFLSHIAPYAFRLVAHTSLPYVFRTLKEKGYCTASFDTDLGLQQNGQPCLGVYSLTRNHISITKTLTRADPRFSFTCAHEIAHYYLHQPIKREVLQEEGDVEIRDSATNFVTSTSSGGPRARMEWQANQFAACILMPRQTVEPVLKGIQSRFGIGRRGRIWLDHQPQNQQDYRGIVSRLAAHYKVSRQVVEIRLRELHLVDGPPSFGLTPIGDVVRSSLADLFGAA